MKERPILFSSPMVRALLDGTKTQTRRVVKPQPVSVESWKHGEPSKDFDISHVVMRDERGAGWANCGKYKCPFGIAGDALWVRETLMLSTNFAGERITYRADDSQRHINEKDLPVIKGRDVGIHDDHTWRPSIFMPRWACRIVLEITSVRVERVASISTLDAIAEGCPWTELEEGNELGYMPPEEAYRTLWDSLNAKRGYGWAKNPWVWVIAFQRKKSTEAGTTL